MEDLDVKMIPDDSSRGHILECDLVSIIYTLYILYIS